MNTSASNDPRVTSNCPLCGIGTPHEHSAVERVIFRNGQKAGLALLVEPKAYLHPATGHVLSAERFKEHEESRARQYQDPFYYVPLFEKPVLTPLTPEASAQCKHGRPIGDDCMGCRMEHGL